LQLGYIYFKKGDYQKSKFYFNKCLTMSGFDYERGIHQKAKSALSRIEN